MNLDEVETKDIPAPAESYPQKRLRAGLDQVHRHLGLVVGVGLGAVLLGCQVQNRESLTFVVHHQGLVSDEIHPNKLPKPTGNDKNLFSDTY
jgi:hypothetical protein